MWFKNIKLYRFTQAVDYDENELDERLQEHRFRPCGKQDKSKFGWVPPLGRHGDLLTHATGGYIMICGQKQEKLLPATVVNEELAEKAQAFEDKEGRKLYRKEREQLKDDIIATLLPRAFTRNQKTFAYISPKDRLLVLNCSSNTKAEEFLAALRETLGSLPVAPVATKSIPSDVLTQWLQQGYGDEHFVVTDECELYNPKEDGNVIRCRGQDLESDEIATHLKAGKRVKQVGIEWNESIQCVIDQELAIKKLKFADFILEQADESNAEDAAQQFDQDFAVMTLELARFFKALFKAMGGLQRKRADLGQEE